jgi:hypothetical protein
MKPGDLVKSKKHKNSIGIITEIFDDLGEDNPWIRVLFTHPNGETYQWVKQSGLILLKENNKKEGHEDPPLGIPSGSL